VAARIVAVTAAVETALVDPATGRPAAVVDVARRLQLDPGRFDPEVVAATIVALDKHGLPARTASEVSS
jgi:hypothetical protein